MKGNNVFTVNEATMCEIVQHYFNTVLFKDTIADQIVYGVTKQGYSFEVNFKQKETTNV